MLLLHGMTSSQIELVPLAHSLANQGFKSYIPMLSGHGSNINQFRRTRARSWILDAHRAMEEVSDNGNQQIAAVGHSFGATLALYLALNRPSQFKKLVLLSPTLVIKPRWGNSVLSMASRLPERFLDYLPVVPKRSNSSYCLVVPRTAYPVYSIGATARMFRIIRRLKAKLNQLSVPTLILRDPNDHLSHPETISILKANCPKHLIEIVELEDANHELLAGKHRQQAFDLISAFLSR